MNILKRIFNITYSSIKRNTNQAVYQITPFAWLALITFPIFYFVNIHYSNAAYENLPLRFVASFLAFLLLTRNVWPQKMKPFIPVLWYLTLLYTLPFFFTFMLIKNNFSIEWTSNMLTFSLLMILLVDWFTFIILTVIGILLALLAYLLTSGEMAMLMGTVYGALSNLTIFILIYSLFSRNRAKLLLETQSILKTFGGSIAHELRTPLVGIRAGLQSFERFQPILSETYLQAQQKGEATGEIEPDQLELLNQVMTNMHYQTDNAFHIIELQLKNMSVDSVNSGEFKVCNITDIIKNALSEYPFNEQEQQLVHWKEDNDFNFYGDLTLTKHILWNLIKNALYYIKAARKGEIRIWLERGDKFNRLHFKDTAQGLSPDIAKKIFDQFFTNRTSGTGLGLAFCKLVMKAYGGDIHCVAKEGEFAEFILSFSKI